VSRLDASIGPRDVLLVSLTSAVRRLISQDILRGAAGGALLAALTLVLTAGADSRRLGLALAAIAGVSTMLIVTLQRSRRWTLAEAAKAVERASPESRNVIVTAEELLRRPGMGREEVRNRVLRDAATAIAPVRSAHAVPLRRAAMLCGATLFGLGGTWVVLSTRSGAVIRQAATDVARTVIGLPEGAARVSATVTSPPYLGSAVQRLEDPERIEAVAGSRLALRITGSEQRWKVRFGTRILETNRTNEGAGITIELLESTYLAIEGESSGAGARRLIPVIVTPDRAPAIVLDRPGKDLLFPDSRPVVPISATAKDDFGMKSLELRFTKVSGSGEQFSFEEGVLPLQLDRESERSWSGRTSLVLAGLKLGPGDSVVYRVVGADARPGQAGMASSDTFVVEIAGPDQVTVAGFELPPDRERYALSQQMIVLKIERLRAREKSISRETLSEEAASIAAGQRAVRANFIFLTGGHIEDEEQEAEQSHEIQEGRLADSARKEMSAAIQYMSRAEQALIAVDTGAALPPAKAAVDALQRAFGRSRYFMRTLPSRSRLDPSRRLAGDLDEAEGSRRTPETATTSPSVRAARDLLVEFLDLAPALEAQPKHVDPGRLASMAERAIAVDAGSPTWQQIAASLMRVRNTVASGGAIGEVEADIRQLIDGLQTEARRDAIPQVRPADENRALRSAWSEHRGRQ
jgi:hypothetical protein